MDRFNQELPDILRPTELHDFGSLISPALARKKVPKPLLAAVAIILLIVGYAQMQAAPECIELAAATASQ